MYEWPMWRDYQAELQQRKDCSQPGNSSLGAKESISEMTLEEAIARVKEFVSENSEILEWMADK